MERRFLSFNEAAEFLRISRSLLEKLVRQGQIASYKLGKSQAGRRIFDQEELVEWVKSHRNDTQAKPKRPEAREIPKKKGGKKKTSPPGRDGGR